MPDESSSSVGGQAAARGEEFRDDLRGARSAGAPAAGSGNQAARRLLGADELAPLTELDDSRSLLAIAQTLAQIALALGIGIAGVAWLGGSTGLPTTLAAGASILLAVIGIGIAQHGLFILAHEAAHYRLFARRRLNDAVGRAIGMASGISMCTYRVIHRLHHNHLYGAQDPDTAIHGGYPRGTAYLWKKLAQDLSGWNAWKTYAYFFGAPAIGEVDGPGRRTAHGALNDTSAGLRGQARADRWWVAGAQLALPAGFALVGGWAGLGLYGLFWLLPMLTVLQPILRLRAICEHGAVDDFASPLTAARSNRCSSGLLDRLGGALLFPHHVNFHLEHHLYPAVPHYHLPRLHALLRDKGVFDEGAEVRDLGQTLRRIFAARATRNPTEPQLTTSQP